MIHHTWLFAWGCLIFVQMFAGQANAISNESTVIDLPAHQQIMGEGELYLGDPSQLPTLESFSTFSELQKSVDEIDLKGGAFWFHAKIRNQGDDEAWVVTPHGSYIEKADVFLFREGEKQNGQSGQNVLNNQLLNYGVEVTLKPGVIYDVWVLLDSRYYSNEPLIAMMPKAEHRDMMFRDTLVVIGCLGGIIILSLYNLMIFSWTREQSYLYYSLYLVSTFVGWCGVFGLFNQLFGVIKVSYMMLPFFINIITNTFFYQRFFISVF